ncbi:MAG: PorV/PorQ family protein [candidate division WOR-3 bacterium]
MKRALMAFGLLAGFVGRVYADANAAGAVVLTIYPGSKAIGMGGAFSAIADDPSTIWYNPAGLGALQGGILYFVHAPWLRTLVQTGDSYFEFASLTSKTSFGTFSFSFTYLTVGEVDLVYDGIDYGTTTPFDMVFTLGYGKELLKTNLGNLYAGGAAKLLYSFLIPRQILIRMGDDPNSGSAWAYAVDGSVYLRKWPGYSISFGLMNFGPGIRFGNSPPDPLPYSARLGVAVVPVYDTVNKLQIAFDIHKVLVYITKDIREMGIDSVLADAWMHIGANYTFYDLVSFRVGYFYDKRGARIGWTFGGGINYKGLFLDIADDTNIYEFNKTGDVDVKANLRFGVGFVKRNFKLF